METNLAGPQKIVATRYRALNHATSTIRLMLPSTRQPGERIVRRIVSLSSQKGRTSIYRRAPIALNSRVFASEPAWSHRLFPLSHQGITQRRTRAVIGKECNGSVDRDL